MSIMPELRTKIVKVRLTFDQSFEVPTNNDFYAVQSYLEKPKKLKPSEKDLTYVSTIPGSGSSSKDRIFHYKTTYEIAI